MIEVDLREVHKIERPSFRRARTRSELADAKRTLGKQLLDSVAKVVVRERVDEEHRQTVERLLRHFVGAVEILRAHDREHPPQLLRRSRPDNRGALS